MYIIEKHTSSTGTRDVSDFRRLVSQRHFYSDQRMYNHVLTEIPTRLHL
jgi:hypothetical protein